MLKIDTALLEEVGLGGLPAEQGNGVLRRFHSTLEGHVGMRLAQQMSAEQLDEFETLIDAEDEAGALAWLERTFPDYKSVVQDEFDRLKNQLAASAALLLTTSKA